MVRAGEAVRLIQQDLPYIQVGSPFLRLVGDEFVSSTESALYLLKDVTQTVGGGSLTNNGTITFALDTDLGNLAPTLSSGSSQYFSRATETALQVGTSSFMASIAFKSSTTGGQVVFSYGSHVAAKGYWELRFNSSNQLVAECWDNTNTVTVTDSIANRFLDNKWHVATMYVDTSLKILVLVVDGMAVGTTTYTTLNTLTVAGESFYIGASKGSGGSVGSFYTGQVALFRLVNNAVDYNAPQVFDTCTRQAISSGTYTIPVNDSNKRLNNKFGTPNTNNSYFLSTISVEAGIYDMIVVYEKGSANGKLDVQIDGSTVLSGLDTYNASTTHNNVSTTRNIKLADGRHLIKILNNGQNGSSTGFTVNLQYITFIKRSGGESGGLVRALLLGDEINDRSNNTNGLTLTNSTSDDYDNDVTQASGAANNDYTEGTLYIKGGLYRIDYIYPKGTTKGNQTISIGNVTVFNAVSAQNGSTTHNNVSTAIIRLGQGRQNVRITATTNTGNNIAFTALKLERLSD